MAEYGKLVRDKIPEVIRADGETPVTRILGDREYRAALLAKLVEEAVELRDSHGDMGERADVAEVLRALDSALGYNEDVIETARAEKAAKRGGFAQRIFLERTDEN